MSAQLTDELEERRVIRLLAGAADAVPPLHEAEVSTVLRLAVSSTSRQARRHFLTRRPQLFAAAAAACLLAALLPIRQPPSDGRPVPTPAPTAAATPAFPQGSALSLLLSRPVAKHA